MPPDDDVQLVQLLAQARTIVDVALVDAATDRRALATAIEARARWADGQATDDYRTFATQLRALIPVLGVEAGDPDTLD
jgi:hypothetical protein